MWLRSVHDERVAQPHVTRFARGRYLGQLRRGVQTPGELEEVRSIWACLGQQRGRVAMTAETNTGGRVVRADLAEQKQHEQHPPPRGQVDPGPAVLVVSARLDVPARIAGIIDGREPDRKRAEVAACRPSTATGELIEGGAQPRRCGRGGKRRIVPVVDPNHRARPG